MEAKDVLAKAKEVHLPVKAENSSLILEEAKNLIDYILTGQYKEAKKTNIITKITILDIAKKVKFKSTKSFTKSKRNGSKGKKC